MLVATIGHVDHGKSTLVQALTGVSTDRLPQEKARGMTLDLGFAYHRMADGPLIGFVDVPGHERFVRHMLAGMCGIDLALIVVAADDGVMPQTREHLSIVNLLEFRRAAIVITQCDRVPDEQVERTIAQVQALLAQTPLADSPVFRTAAPVGMGIASLLSFLETQALHTPPHDASAPGFRLAIDRAFTIAGSGTVVTGTVFDGVVHTGDALVVSPTGAAVRVRGLRMHDQGVSQASRGQRCAINLAGVSVEDVMRGHWVVSPGWHRPTTAIDVRLHVMAGQSHGLSQAQRVRLHLGTADVEARVLLPRGDAPADESCFVQLRLSQPVCALRGDRFILRDLSRRLTLGGGIVMDPLPAAERIGSAARALRMRALACDAPSAVLQACIDHSSDPVNLDWFRHTCKLSADTADQLVEDLKLVRLGSRQNQLLSQERAAELSGSVLAWLDARAVRPGKPRSSTMLELRKVVAPRWPEDGFASLLQRMTDAGRLVWNGRDFCTGVPDPSREREDLRRWARVEPKLLSGRFQPVTCAELSRRLGLDHQDLWDFFYRMVALGKLLRVGDDRFYPRTTINQLARLAIEVAQAQPAGRFTAAQFRDAIGTGRSLAIDILEALDRQRVTVRAGNLRRILHTHQTPPSDDNALMAARRKHWRYRHRFSTQGASS